MWCAHGHSVFGAVLALSAPIFFLMSLGVEPGEHSRFFFIFFSMIALTAAMWATSSVEIISGKWLVPTLTFVQVRILGGRESGAALRRLRRGIKHYGWAVPRHTQQGATHASNETR